MKAQDEILLYLNENKDRLPLATIDIANKLNLSRSVVSHYLNSLSLSDDVVKIDGRPVLWTLKSLNKKVAKEYSFDDFIGASGSLKQVVSQCEAAVNYPPNGLSIIITGNSGVGKSFLAKEIYKYSLSHKIITTNAPFLTLNCADYANNPELLSSILFGYVKGAFTGANSDKEGLLEQANGGYLFLDEVHRLSSENQEKLFNFIDSGEFRRVGENKNSRRSKVRFLFATTEQVDDVLLETFRRRISISIKLPDFQSRPVIERVNIIYAIFYQEAKRIGRPLKIHAEVLNKLVNLSSSGNVGRLKNIIKVKCANAYKEQMKSLVINIREQGIEDSEDLVKINPQENYDFATSIIDNSTRDKVLEIMSRLVDDHIDFEKASQSALNDILKIDTVPINQLYLPGYLRFKRQYDRVIVNQFGVKSITDISKIIYSMYENNFDFDESKIDLLSEKMNEIYPRSVHLSQYFFKTLHQRLKNKLLELVMALLLSDCVDERFKMRGLLLAHGDHTATSIQSVVNQLCGEYILDAIDMPIDTSIDSIVEQTKKLFDSYDTSNGIVMIVDMGSLSQIYSEIKGHIGGHLLVIDNLTTAVALDVALKIQNQERFKKIALEAESDYKIHTKYYSGFSNKKNIIISCISGLGISEKIKETMLPYFPKEIQINTIDYHDLKNRILDNDEKYFDTTFLVLTTTSLPSNFRVANINIYDLLDDGGEKRFSKIISAYLNSESIKKLNKELLRFFSIEGISERLSFLNPEVIIKEVEDIIYKYESYYKLKLSGKVKLNFYMHIALMIERLMVDKSIDVPEVNPDQDESDFIVISKDIFKPIERKYNVKVNNYELSLMYEVFKTIRS
ncbi:sigma 54-interacting transcriptional regulator [Companilactobacillus muriivasis]|uniref:sigma 54-interacting transcriptional regulator n=1 Tax=Companilactobacillus muriivasis TaxID=3081444 RepID=UPI0030C778E6